MTGDVKCPECNRIHTKVDLDVKYRPWFALCMCGSMLTFENVILETIEDIDVVYQCDCGAPL